MSISQPKHSNKDKYHSELITLTDVKATFREVLACDTTGKIYHCDLNYS